MCSVAFPLIQTRSVVTEDALNSLEVPQLIGGYQTAYSKSDRKYMWISNIISGKSSNKIQL